PSNLHATGDLDEALADAELVLSVVPTIGLRDVLGKAAGRLPAGAPIVSCTKGIETSTLKLVSEIFEELLPEASGRVTYLAGPSFAREVAARMPTAVTVAGTDEETCHRVQALLMNDSFRVYTT